MKSTSIGGKLKPIQNCYIKIPVGPYEYMVVLDNLPDISDSKTAQYNDESVIGRSSPLKTYAHSDSRSISMTLHFITSQKYDIYKNIQDLRAIQSAVYPREGESGAPFIPPPVCKIKCGKLLALESPNSNSNSDQSESSGGELCVILKSYSVKYPTDVVWDEVTYIPYKFDVDTTWDVVYTSQYLPGQERIFNLGK